MFRWNVLNSFSSRFSRFQSQRSLSSDLFTKFITARKGPRICIKGNENLTLCNNNIFIRSKAKLTTRAIVTTDRKLWYIVIGSAIIIGPGLYGLKKIYDKSDLSKGVSTIKEKTKKPIYVDLPTEVPYLIIGAGTAAYAACRSIRASDLSSRVLIVGDEMYLPYMRPPLSKELWYTEDKEKVKKLTFKSYTGKERTLFFEKEDYFAEPKDLDKLEHGGIAVALGLKASRIDVENQIVHFTNGQKIGYHKCLIATGGTPKNLPTFKDVSKEISDRITLFRTIDDFLTLDELTRKVKNIVIVGGGFMGSELACALGKRASDLKTFKVTQIFPEKGNMGLVLPEYLSRWATEKVKEEGTQVLTEKQLTAVRYNHKTKQVILGLQDGNELEADHVIVAVGLDPNIELAKESGLEVDPHLGGFLVNAELEARTNLWVAGDAACFFDPKLGRRRVEHHDHAVVSGRLAGENMAGAHKPYWHQSMLWSDLGATVGYEAIGLVDSSLPTISIFAKADPVVSEASSDAAIGDEVELKDVSNEKLLIKTPSQLPNIVEVSCPAKEQFKEEFGKGVVFYLRDDVVVGVLLWNVFNKMPIARQIIKESRKFDDYTEVAKLFHLFGSPEEEKEELEENKKVAQ